jgi:hypothetical protein
MESQEDKLAFISKAEKLLSPRELSAYKWALNNGSPELSTDLQTKLFGLFLQGTSCADIAKFNPGITLAQILVARVRWDWDERRAEYIEQLQSNAMARLAQVTMEGVDFVSSLLAAHHKEYGERSKGTFRRAIRTNLGPSRF